MSVHIEKFYLNDIKVGENGEQHFLSSSALKKSESIALYNIINKYKPEKTLEIGLSLGGSAIAIISGKLTSGIQEKHIALDPHQKVFGNNACLVALKELGIESELIHLEEFSENYLNKLYTDRKYFDFIFIDGNHTIGQAVTDVFLADKILNDQGIIGVHDSLLFSTAASIRYLVLEKNYTIIKPEKRSLKNLFRQIKYFRKLGLWYCLHVIPNLHVSIIFLKKTAV